MISCLFVFTCDKSFISFSNNDIAGNKQAQPHHRPQASHRPDNQALLQPTERMVEDNYAVRLGFTEFDFNKYQVVTKLRLQLTHIRRYYVSTATTLGAADYSWKLPALEIILALRLMQQFRLFQINRCQIVHPTLSCDVVKI
ncbi:hypothetical protein J6590_022434 [Homalodisca vitripennis]|nr:hypothetical protein J6590_022434 [Homalodisca vitripennis]